jgi:hypothetical protein
MSATRVIPSVLLSFAALRRTRFTDMIREDNETIVTPVELDLLWG